MSGFDEELERGGGGRVGGDKLGGGKGGIIVVVGTLAKVALSGTV